MYEFSGIRAFVLRHRSSFRTIRICGLIVGIYSFQETAIAIRSRPHERVKSSSISHR